MAENNKIKVLFVCLGNICRSPMAEAVFRHIVEGEGLADRFEIASSGTSSYHLGERPHSGTRAILKKNNVDVDPLKRAQKLRQDEVKAYDYVVAMDADNASELAAWVSMHSVYWNSLHKAARWTCLTHIIQIVLRKSTNWSGPAHKGLLDQIRKEEGL
jgi:protein-tyrosine-phosphatase